jgi:hypothetical protein
MLELLDRRGRFAEHVGPGQPRDVPGRHTITSGAVAFGLDADENRRLQITLLEANVLSSIAATFTGPGIAVLQRRKGLLRRPARRDDGRDPGQRRTARRRVGRHGSTEPA